MLFKNEVSADSIPNLAAVVSSCCTLINLNRVPLVASKVVAILSLIVARKARCSTLKAIPWLTRLSILDANVSCFISGETPAYFVRSLVNLSQYDPPIPKRPPPVFPPQPCSLVSTALFLPAIASMLFSSCFAISAIAATALESSSLPSSLT